MIAVRKPYYWSQQKGWYLRIPREEDPKKFRTVPLAKTKTEAFEVWRRMTAAGAKMLSDGPLISDLVVEFTARRVKAVRLGQVSPATVKRQIERLSNFTDWVEASYPSLAAAELSAQHIERWLDSNDGWGATTRSDSLKALKAVTKWARESKRITENPIAQVSEPGGVSDARAITEEEHVMLCEAVTKRNRNTLDYLNALKLSGCRPGEPAKVMIEHLRKDAWVIHQHKNARRTGRPRVVYLNSELQNLTEQWRCDRTKGHLLLRENGEPWRPTDLRVRFMRLRNKAAIDGKVVPYSYRHAWITNALRSGIEVARVAVMAGTSIKMIQDTYSHVADYAHEMSEAAERVWQMNP